MKRKHWILVLCAILLVGFVAHIIATAPYRWSGRLVSAIRTGDNEKALQLIAEGIEKGYSMDTPTLRPSWLTKLCECTSYTPLAVACYEHNVTIVEALLENGSTFKGAKEGANGRSPVFFALSAPYSSELLDILILLADAGEDFCKDPYDGYPLHWASKCQFPQTSSAPLTKQEYHQRIAEIIIFIMQHMPDPYVADGSGRTALHYAAINENWYLCELLVSVYNFPLDSRTNIDGLTAYDIALQNNAPAEILRLLMP